MVKLTCSGPVEGQLLPVSLVLGRWWKRWGRLDCLKGGGCLDGRLRPLGPIPCHACVVVLRHAIVVVGCRVLGLLLLASLMVAAPLTALRWLWLLLWLLVCRTLRWVMPCPFTQVTPWQGAAAGIVALHATCAAPDGASPTASTTASSTSSATIFSLLVPSIVIAAATAAGGAWCWF